jgi:hypothetical protein
MKIEQEKKYSLELTGEEIALVQGALAELPFKISGSLIYKLPEIIKEIKPKVNEKN